MRARETVYKAERKLGEHADVEVDHGKLLAAIEIRGRSDQPKSGIVDDILRRERASLKSLVDSRLRIVTRKINRQHQRCGLAGRGDFAGKRGQTLRASRDQNKSMAIARKR